MSHVPYKPPRTTPPCTHDPPCWEPIPNGFVWTATPCVWWDGERKRWEARQALRDTKETR